MPLVRFDTVEGALDEETKKKLSEAFTNVVVEVIGEKMKNHTWVIINEAPEGNFYVGGHELKSSVYHHIMAANKNT